MNSTYLPRALKQQQAESLGVAGSSSQLSSSSSQEMQPQEMLFSIPQSNSKRSIKWF